MPVEDNETSEQACCRYISSKLSEPYSCKSNTMFPSLKDLPTLYYSSRQFPDVTVHDRKVPDLPVILVEVHSSPYEDSIMKCIIGVVDQLRLYRSYNSSITTCTGYVFPKLKVKQCVVEVQVTWTELVFWCKLTPIIDKQRIDLETTAKAASVPSTNNDQRKHFVVTLSPDDLQLFGSGTFQKPSNSSILVNRNSTWYKYPISVDERDTLKEFIQVTDNPHKISFRTEKKGRLSFLHTTQ